MSTNINQSTLSKAGSTRPNSRLWLFRITAVACSIVLCFVVLETAVHFIEPPNRRAYATPAWETDPVYGFRYIQGYPTVEGNTFANVRPFKMEGNTTRIAFIGDSYIDGNLHGDPNLAIPAKVEQRLRQRLGQNAAETMNFGLSSTGAVHYYIRYTRIVRRYRPNVVVIAIHDNDVIETSELSPNFELRPIFKRKPGSDEVTNVSFAHSPDRLWIRRWLRKSALYRLIRFREQPIKPLQRGDGFEQFLNIYLESRDASSIEAERQFYYWTQKLYEAIRQDGATPLFIYLQAKECVLDDEGERVRRIYQLNCDYTKFDERLSSWMSTNGMPFVSFLSKLREQNDRQLYLPDNVPAGGGMGHLNTEGNDFVADVLVPILADLIRPETAMPKASAPKLD